MKLSTRSRYSTRILVELASLGNEMVSLGEITARHQVSRSYVRNSIAPLVNAGIIESHRGFGGGFRLARPAREVKLGDIVRMLEGSNLVLECVNRPEVCHRSQLCIMREIWQMVDRAIASVLDSITLEDLVIRFRRKANLVSQQDISEENMALKGTSEISATPEVII